MARALHVGPYEQLGDTHTAVLGWMSEQGHAPGGPIWEVYLTDPNQVEDPADYQNGDFLPAGLSAVGVIARISERGPPIARRKEGNA